MEVLDQPVAVILIGVKQCDHANRIEQKRGVIQAGAIPGARRRTPQWTPATSMRSFDHLFVF